MSDAPGSPAAAVRTPSPPARLSWGDVLRAAFSLQFESIHALPMHEQRRVGVVATVVGALLAVAGVLLGAAISAWMGFGTKVFFIVAGWGGCVLGIGAYRVGISYFPSMAGPSRWASLARVAYLLLVMGVLGGGVLWVFLREP